MTTPDLYEAELDAISKHADEWCEKVILPDGLPVVDPIGRLIFEVKWRRLRVARQDRYIATLEKLLAGLIQADIPAELKAEITAARDTRFKD